jgi:hypothetical protein
MGMRKKTLTPQQSIVALSSVRSEAHNSEYKHNSWPHAQEMQRGGGSSGPKLLVYQG